MTRACWSAAQRIARVIELGSKELGESPPPTLATSSLAFGDIPSIPWPLPSIAPISPATAVPCGLSGYNGLPLPNDRAPTIRPARSGCSPSTPVSTIATFTGANEGSVGGRPIVARYGCGRAAALRAARGAGAEAVNRTATRMQLLRRDRGRIGNVHMCAQTATPPVRSSRRRSALPPPSLVRVTGQQRRADALRNRGDRARSGAQLLSRAREARRSRPSRRRSQARVRERAQSTVRTTKRPRKPQARREGRRSRGGRGA